MLKKIPLLVPSRRFPVETLEFSRMQDEDEKDKSNHKGDSRKKSPPSPNSVVLFSSLGPPKASVGQQQHQGSQQTDSLTTDDYSSSSEDYLALPPNVRRRSDSPSSSLTSNELSLILDEDDYHAHDNEVLQQQQQQQHHQQQEQPEVPCMEDDNHHKNEAELIPVSKKILADFDDLAAMVEAEATAASAEEQQVDIETPSSSSRWTQHQLLIEHESQRKSKQHQRYEALHNEWQIYQGFLQRRYKKLVKGEQFLVSRRFSTVKDHSTRRKDIIKFTLREAKHLGDNIKEQLKTMEDQVAKTWSLYENLITSDTHLSHPICVDEWMLELRYCTQVQHQLNLWNTSLTELCTMFHLVRHELSMYREELFLLFHQQRISKSIAMAYLGATSEEDPPKQGNSCIFSNIENNNVEGSSSPTANRAVPVSPPSPMKSSLLVSSKIIERRNDDGRWTDTLAIVTVDSVLHFFDFLSEQSSKSPKEILDQMLLSLSLELLTPSLSIYLPNCSHYHKVRHVSGTHGEDLEIVEAYLDTNGCFTTRKILLRTASSKDTIKWSQNVFVTC